MVIRIRIVKKNRQYNGQTKKNKRTNNDLQNITHKTKDCINIKAAYINIYTHVGAFSVFNDFRRYLVLRIVDIGGIVDHHCLIFFSIIGVGGVYAERLLTDGNTMIANYMFVYEGLYT